MTIDQLQPLAETVDEPLVQLLERAHLAARPVEHHDDDGKGGGEVEAHEGGVNHEVRGAAGLGMQPQRRRAMDGPQPERDGQQARTPIANSGGRGRPEGARGQGLGSTKEHPDDVARQGGGLRKVIGPEGAQGHQAADDRIARPMA